MSTPVLLYDGDCGMCAQSVQFVLRHEPPSHRAPLNFAALNSAFARTVRASFPQLVHVDSVIWYEPAIAGRAEQVFLRSDAALRALAHLGGVWRVLAWCGALVPRVVRDGVYRAIARRRHRLGLARCVLPSPSESLRFLA